MLLNHLRVRAPLCHSGSGQRPFCASETSNCPVPVFLLRKLTSPRTDATVKGLAQCWSGQGVSYRFRSWSRNSLHIYLVLPQQHLWLLEDPTGSNLREQAMSLCSTFLSLWGCSCCSASAASPELLQVGKTAGPALLSSLQKPKGFNVAPFWFVL